MADVKVSSIKNLTKKPSGSYAEIMKILRTTCAMTGADILQKDYRMNTLTFMTISVIATYCVLIVHTIIKIFPEDWKVLLQATSTISPAIQASIKLGTAVCYQQDLYRLCKLFQEIYEKYEARNEMYFTVIKEKISFFKWLVIGIGIFYILALITIIVLSYTFTAISGTPILLFEFHIPMIDIKTVTGYNVTNVIQILFVTLGSFGLYSGDIITVTFLMQCFTFAAILKLKVQEINQATEEVVNQDTELAIDQQLKDIIQWHQLYTQFKSGCNTIFSYIVTFQVLSSAVAIIMAIFILLTTYWPPGYIFLVFTIYNLYVYCILGTKIDDCNDEFFYEIYNISWYNMTVRQQKMVRLMITKTFEPATIQVAGVMPLTVATAMQLTKGIYSCAMIILQFFVE